ncbi:class I SAM-dependent methyltransferase [Crocinitomicaceae bacterium]|nr:class I SAM-dependent methyltransferase [Crocinitomicaceae bacterium]
MSRIYSGFWSDYELLDAGNSEKLERWGDQITIRPDRNAYFKPVWSREDWLKKADYIFEEETHTKGRWVKNNPEANETWTIQYHELSFELQLTKFKHVGLFPEQRTNWDFIQSNIEEDDRFLNLFGYTGGASLAARSVGAEVYHCDAVRQINAWAKSNMEASGLSDIRWVLDDALKFAQRELKRGNRYKGVIMDPPAFGIGAKKERWKIEQKFHELLEIALEITDPGGFIIMNTYSPKLPASKIKTALTELGVLDQSTVETLAMKTTTGKVLEYGELTRINR